MVAKKPKLTPKKDKKEEYKPKVFKGKVYIIKERCKGCGFCVEYCAHKMLEVSKDFNLKGYHYPVVKDETACLNCKICEDICPDFAIYSIAKEDDRNK